MLHAWPAKCVLILVTPFLSASGFAKEGTDASQPILDREAKIKVAVDELINMQEEGGAWPYEGVYRVNREIPVGYRIGGTSLAALALLHATDHSHAQARKAIDDGIAFVVRTLGHRLMAPSKEDRYDVRVWGHACALEFFCQVKLYRYPSKQMKEIDAWIDSLTQTLITEEIDGGGWNYANQRYPATFVTAPVAQSLLWAKKVGKNVPDEVMQRAMSVIAGLKSTQGGFQYSGSVSTTKKGSGRATIPGSAARSPLCESTLLLLGGGSQPDLETAVSHFFKHWDDLESRRKKTGTHVPPYGIAPYYFYFGHRYTSQAIQLLPEDKRERWNKLMREHLEKTRDSDGTWNDRVFPRSRNYGTSMAIMALLEDRMPVPR